MLITLPDKSIARLDRSTLKFFAVEATACEIFYPLIPEMQELVDTPLGIDCHNFVRGMVEPSLKFGDRFKRKDDTPSYYLRPNALSVDLDYLTSVYKYPGNYSGVMFSNATLDWDFLDGGITFFMACGFGNRSYTIVRGYEALRFICMFYGVFQPLKIKGEIVRRNLAVILQEATNFPLTDRTRLPNLPNYGHK